MMTDTLVGVGSSISPPAESVTTCGVCPAAIRSCKESTTPCGGRVTALRPVRRPTALSRERLSAQVLVEGRGPRSRISARSSAVAVRCSWFQVHMLHPRWVKPICSS
jgi:hypothetical protein